MNTNQAPIVRVTSTYETASGVVFTVPDWCPGQINASCIGRCAGAELKPAYLSYREYICIVNDVHLFEAAIDLLSFASLKEMQNYEWNAVDDNGIVDTEGFRKFLRACAAFSGQLLNYNDLGTTAGVSGVTAKEWVKVLQSMGIIFLLEPYYSNELKRRIKTPKLYFCDTGLCAFLSSWTSRDVLMNGAASGHFLENYVVAEMIRNVSYGEKEMNLNFYRDTNQKEIDLVVEADGVLHPFEIKRSASPDRKATKVFSLLEKADRSLGNGGIICMAEKPFPIDSKNNLIPVNIL